MKAAISAAYGPPEVVALREVPTPAPSADQVRVKVHATTVNRTDCGMRTPYPFFARAFTGLITPKIQILGFDFAGIIDMSKPAKKSAMSSWKSQSEWAAAVVSARPPKAAERGVNSKQLRCDVLRWLRSEIMEVRL